MLIYVLTVLRVESLFLVGHLVRNAVQSLPMTLATRRLTTWSSCSRSVFRATVPLVCCPPLQGHLLTSGLLSRLLLNALRGCLLSRGRPRSCLMTSIALFHRLSVVLPPLSSQPTGPTPDQALS